MIALALVLQQFAFKIKQFVILVGESATTAESNLQSIIDELENNELLLEDFPHLKPAIDAKSQFVKWTDRQLVFDSGATVIAKGIGARLRGLKRKQFRPDLAILDDPESPETADTFMKRKKHKNWFGGTFFGLGATGWDVYVIGNLIHKECLIADLLQDPEWDGKVYRAENKPVGETFPYRLGNTKDDGSALWPEGWSLEALAAYRRRVGTLIYAREMMNNPIDDADKKFDTAQFAYFDFTTRMLIDYEAIVSFIDPAGGQKPNELKAGKKDFCAIVTGGRRRDNKKIQIFDVEMTKELPKQQIELLLKVYTNFKPTRIGAEENIYKNLLVANIQEMGQQQSLYLPVEAIHQTQNKITRVLSIQPPIESQSVEFARHLIAKCPKYFEQFDEFPGDHDDGPDATEGVIRLLENNNPLSSGAMVGTPRQQVIPARPMPRRF